MTAVAKRTFERWALIVAGLLDAGLLAILARTAWRQLLEDLGCISSVLTCCEM